MSTVNWSEIVDLRKNMSGSLSSVNSVNEVKMTAGSRVWPVAEYVMKASTDARTGMLIATALFAARISNNVRMYLTDVLAR